MRIVIETPVLAEPAAFRHIDALIERLALHRLTVDEIALLESHWARARDNEPHFTDLQMYLAGPPGGEDPEGPALHRSVLTVSDEATAERARRCVYSPLVVLVEDYEADGRFLEVVVEELGGALAELWDACLAASPAGVDFESAAIGNMPARIKRRAEATEREKRPLRLLVIHDSDRRWPGDSRPDTEIGNVASACREHGAPPPHCLEKRAVENYIPDSTLRAMRDATPDRKKRRSLHALLSLPAAARDHFPMKGPGLTPDEMSGGLYDEIDVGSLTGRHLLFPKKGRPMALLLDVDNRRSTFTAEALRIRDGKGELDALLQRIADAL